MSERQAQAVHYLWKCPYSSCRGVTSPTLASSLSWFFFKQNLLCIFLLDTKHAHIMQDEAATAHTASLSGEGTTAHRAQSAFLQTPQQLSPLWNPSSPKTWHSRSDSLRSKRQHPELNSNTGKYQISSRLPIRPCVSFMKLTILITSLRKS